MIIEFLKVKVPPKQREKYILKDEEIWTAALAQYPGFLGKEVWINPNNPTEVILVICWSTREHWKALPANRLEAIERKFAQAMGGYYPLVEFVEYQVRKFRHSYSHPNKNQKLVLRDDTARLWFPR